MPYVTAGRLDRQQRVATIASDQGQLDGPATFPPQFVMATALVDMPRTILTEYRSRVAQIASDQGQVDGPASFPSHLPPVTPITDFPNPRTILTDARNRTPQIASDQGQLDGPASFPPHEPTFNPFNDFPNPNGWAMLQRTRTQLADSAQDQLEWPQTMFAPFIVDMPDQPNPKLRPPYPHEIGQAFNPTPSLPTRIVLEQPNPKPRPPYGHEAGPSAKPMLTSGIGARPVVDFPNPVRPFPPRHEFWQPQRLVRSILSAMATLEQPNPTRPLRLRDYTWLNVGLKFPAPSVIFRRTLSALGTRIGARQVQK